MKFYLPVHGSSAVDHELLVFPDTQPKLRLPSIDAEYSNGTLIGPIATANDVLELLLWADALRNLKAQNVTLTITYLMGGRSDRREEETESFTLKVIADAINTCNFSKVYLIDPHSDVSAALIRNSSVITPYNQVGFAIKDAVARFRAPVGQPVLVCPDAGALKKTEKYSRYFSLPMVLCTKHRDMKTGKLSGFRVHDDVWGKFCFIVDDICDGGGTFVAEAKLLREAGASTVVLYTTHGIYSKGLPLDGIDYVYTTDSYPRSISYTNDILKVFTLGGTVQ